MKWRLAQMRRAAYRFRWRFRKFDYDLAAHNARVISPLAAGRLRQVARLHFMKINLMSRD